MAKVPDEIRWLEEDKERLRTFIIIATRGPVVIREVRKLLGSSDWWPVKCHLSALVEHGLVAESDVGYRLTLRGEKVYEARKAVYYLEGVK
jgi:predicted transcriptional regulator